MKLVDAAPLELGNPRHSGAYGHVDDGMNLNFTKSIRLRLQLHEDVEF